MADPQEEGRTLAGDLVAATRAGEMERVAQVIGHLAGLDRDEHLRVLGGLAHCCAAAVAEHFGPQPAHIVFTTVLEGHHAPPADVDVLAPGVRAALRAILAELNGDQAGREIQLELAAQGSSREIVPVLVHCLLWAVKLGTADSDERIRFLRSE